MANPKKNWFPDNCNEYQHAPQKCEHPVFTSADGSIRCHGCHLHPDQCTCGGEFLRILKMLGILVDSETFSEAEVISAKYQRNTMGTK
jgi:hypothetical protein